MTVKELIRDYIGIIEEDGSLTKDQLINMLSLDESLEEVKRTDETLNKIADEILNSKYRTRMTINNERMEFYNQGLSDRKIGEIQNVSTASIKFWREKRDLIANPTERELKIREKNKKRIELYNQGLSDEEIAEITGFKVETIKIWRKSNMKKQEEI